MFKLVLFFIIVSSINANALVKSPLSFLDDTDPAGPDNNATAQKVPSDIDYRLPNIYDVQSYAVILDVYLDEEDSEKNNFTFTGIVDIEFQLKNTTKEIIFHNDNLKIKDPTLKKKGSTPMGVTLNSDPFRHFSILKPRDQENFEPAEYFLHIDYSGKLSNDSRGFYKSSYYDDTQKTTVWLAATQFEPISARRAFPCFDEPQYKATFSLTIKHHQNYMAISNTKVKSISNSTGRVETQFMETPKMSTYLLAFVISDFKNVTNKDNNFTIHAQPNAMAKTQLAKTYSEKILKELEKFTNISYEESKIGKIDQVAVPSYTGCGMENWGLVIYSENCFLYDEKTSTSAEKYNIMDTIAHELAHQWFGNLVTPKWWEYLWLKEGFSTFFASYIMDQIGDSSSARLTEFTVVKNFAYVFDSLNETHAMNRKVNSSKEITSSYDTIAYDKSGLVIRMMQHVLTTPVFQKGLQNYLDKHQFSATDSDDLFDAIEDILKEENKDSTEYLKIKDIMSTWINQEGYPIITVTRNYENNQVELKQDRFLDKTYGSADNFKNKKYIWHIPINYATETNPDFNDTKPLIWFNEESNKNTQIKVEAKDWIILNKQQTGFYRVNYDDKNWELLTNYLKYSENRNKIHAINRAQLINDAWIFANQDSLKLLTFFNLFQTYKNESDIIAWYPGFNILDTLRQKFTNSEYYTRYQKFALEVTQKLVEKIGFESNDNDDIITKINRNRVLRSVCVLDHEGCIPKMKEKFSAWLVEPGTHIDPDLKESVLCFGLKSASVEDWEKVLMKTQNDAMLDKERNILYKSLACSTNEKILQNYLDYSLSNDTFSKLDLVTIVKHICDQSSRTGLNIVLDFVFDNIIHIYFKYQNNDKVRQILTYIGAKITTEDTLKRFKDRCSKFPENLTKDSIAIAETNIKWLKDHKEHLTTWKQVNGVGSFSASVGLISLLLAILYAAGN